MSDSSELSFFDQLMQKIIQQDGIMDGEDLGNIVQLLYQTREALQPFAKFYLGSNALTIKDFAHAVSVLQNPPMATPTIELMSLEEIRQHAHELLTDAPDELEQIIEDGGIVDIDNFPDSDELNIDNTNSAL